MSAPPEGIAVDNPAKLSDTENFNEGSDPHLAVAPLVADLLWLSQVIQLRIDQIHGKDVPAVWPGPPVLPPSPFADWVAEVKLEPVDRLLLACSMVPHLAPAIFDRVLIHPEKRQTVMYPDFGGYIDGNLHTFRPTVQTIVFLITGSDLGAFMHWTVNLSAQSQLVRDQIVVLNAVSGLQDRGNQLNYAVQLQSEYLRLFMLGETPKPDFGHEFPATLMSSKLEWDDLVLPGAVSSQIDRIKSWLKHHRKLMEYTEGKVSLSFPCLFHGAPGTGKTLTCQLLGKEFKKPVFRIDLSMVVSKYIGETEKNLSRLFDRAHGKGWILFFDEADSLFGKRTDIKSSNDKWANLEVSFLLQKIEEYDGLVILATNLKNNIDAALIRRFQAIIGFPKPGKEEQRILWEKLLPRRFAYAPEVNLEAFLNYNFTGANIANVLKQACLSAVAAGVFELTEQHVDKAVKVELKKENRTT